MDCCGHGHDQTRRHWMPSITSISVCATLAGGNYMRILRAAVG
jgi:hypothetical protein